MLKFRVWRRWLREAACAGPAAVVTAAASSTIGFICAVRLNLHRPELGNDKVAAFARHWVGLVLTRRNDYVLKFD